MPALNAVRSQTSLIDVARSAGQFRVWLRLAATAQVVDALCAPGPFTLFAPTDEAFDAFPQSTLRKLTTPANKSLLQAVLNYHFAQGKVMTARIAGKRIRGATMEGGDLRISGIGGLFVNGASIVLPDNEAYNGVLHGIDRVLWPATRAVQTPTTVGIGA